MAATRRTSLGIRVFLLTALTVAGAVLAALLVTRHLADGIAEDSVRADLVRGGAARATLEEQRLDQLGLIARLFVADPYLAAYFAEAAESGDGLSILDLLSERQVDLGFDFAIALDPRGRVLVRTDVPGGAGRDLSGDPLVERALAEFAAYGVRRERGALYNAVAVPITSGPRLTGFLIAGFAIDDVAALQTKRVTDTEVSFFSVSDGDYSALAGTVDADVAAALAARLPDPPSEPFEITAAGERWLALHQPIQGADGETLGAAFSLASLDREKEPFRKIIAVMALCGLAAVLLASGGLFLLSRKAIEPLGRLAAAAKAAVGGNLDAVIETGRRDEVGELAEAFDRLLAELRQRRDMAAYLAQIDRTIPREATPSAPIEVLVPPHEDGEMETIYLGMERPAVELDGRFEILSTLGEGGMGIVYKARDLVLDDIVALKTFRPEISRDEAWQEQLKRELKLARSVTHPNVLRTFDFGEIQGTPFISMEYVEGIDLAALLARSGRLPYSAGLHIARQLCRGLGAVHAEGVLHRDIKPANLIVQPNGNAKIMDFGIARPARDLREGETGKIIGTPDYLSPEQVRGEEPTERSDIYACGVVFYEVFTSAKPFAGNNPMTRMVARLRGPAEPSRSHWPEIPEPLEELLSRCLETEPEARYPDVASLLADLEALRA